MRSWMTSHDQLRGVDSSVVRAPDSWLKGRGFESLQSGGRMFFSRVDFLYWLISVSVPPPCYRRCCQKCRWQVTAKHTCGFAWSDMEHGCMVYTELAPRRQQFHVAPAMPALKYATSVDIQKRAMKKLVTHVESHASAMSLLKRAENSAI